MACCKVPQNRSRVSLAIERRLNEWRGVTCSRLFAFSPRVAGAVYRSFGLCLSLTALTPVALAFVLAYAAC